MLGSIETLKPVLSPQQIVDGLPRGDYTDFFQPTYPNEQALREAVYELESTTPVTLPEHIMEMRARFASIAQGEDMVVIMDGRCAEPVRVDMPIAELAEEAVTSDQVIAASGLARVLHVRRCCGQCCKPRSNERETLADGMVISSYMGDMVNGKAASDRIPDPSRMVAAAVQARDVEAIMTERLGGHVFAGHEALLLPYEQSFLRRDPTTGRMALLSADLPWIGVRTNRTDTIHNPHIELLASVENVVGVKVGADSDATHIAELAERLNPDHEPGKLVFMIRVGDDRAAMDRILSAVKQSAPESIIMYDIHGSTIKIGDQKVRTVATTIDHIRILAEASAQHGLRLHGLHIETMGDDKRKECLDSPDEPLEHITHKGDVDPQFNPGQLRAILDGVAPFLQRNRS